MPLPKQALNIPFGQGVQTMTDKKQLSFGQMDSLVNAVFNKDKQVEKRNGYLQLPATTSTSLNTVASFKNGLVALGNSLSEYVQGLGAWANKGTTASIDTNTYSLVSLPSAQFQYDTAVSTNGLACTVYTVQQDDYYDLPPSTPKREWTDRMYVSISDYATGDILYQSGVLASIAGTTVFTAAGLRPRVFVSGANFYVTHVDGESILYTKFDTTTLPIVLTSGTITSPGAQVNYDCVVNGTRLYVAWNEATTKLAYFDLNTNTLSSITSIAFPSSSLVAIAVDTSGGSPIIWVGKGVTSGGSFTARVATFTSALVPILAPTISYTSSFSAANTGVNITLSAKGGTGYFSYTLTGTAAAYSNQLITINSAGAGTLYTNPENIYNPYGVYGVVLASKSYIIGTDVYALYVYGGIATSAQIAVSGVVTSLEPTYFLLKNASTVVAKLSPQNAGRNVQCLVGEYIELPSITVIGNDVYFAYLRTGAVTTYTIALPTSFLNETYNQTTVYLAKCTVINTPSLRTDELANNLHIASGLLNMYDGNRVVEHGFNLFPEHVSVAIDGFIGGVPVGTYSYSIIYEWKDAQGNVHQSAPSVPVTIVQSVPGTRAIDITVPTFGITAKTDMVAAIYRYSLAQPVYHRVYTGSVATSGLNPSATVTFVDTGTDTQISRNPVLYTTGGVLENIAAPAFCAMTTFKGRIVGIVAENRNLLWYSKQVAESVPVEFTDLFTYYMTPTAASPEQSGPLTAVSSLDDKLILFKENAIYYIVGDGPDLTGANNNFSEPILISSAVGCSDPRSLVLTPQGLMFQSSKGIWMLGRDLNCTFIGSPVEALTHNNRVLSAITMPESTQIRFTMEDGSTLMYDYYYNQWGTFSNVSAVSSCLYGNLHAYVNSSAQVFVETPDTYLDGANPVLMSFTTGWLNLAGVQGFERAYFFQLLGEYLSPHKLTVSIAYNYNETPTQTLTISPTNASTAYSEDLTAREQWRIFLKQQKIQAFKITVQEVYNGAAGAGLSLSSLNLVASIKKGYTTLRSRNSAS